MSSVTMFVVVVLLPLLAAATAVVLVAVMVLVTVAVAVVAAATAVSPLVPARRLHAPTSPPPAHGRSVKNRFRCALCRRSATSTAMYEDNDRGRR